MAAVALAVGPARVGVLQAEQGVWVWVGVGVGVPGPGLGLAKAWRPVWLM